MKVLLILCTAVLTLAAFNSGAATAITADDEFNPKATEWAEGTLSQVEKDGHFQLSGAKSPYAGEFAEYHRQYFSFPETERELQRKQLQDRYQGRMTYLRATDKPVTFTFNAPDTANTLVFDESGIYGNNLNLWTYPDKPVISSYSDLKIGDRIVVGYDTSEQVHSIYRVNPVIVLSGENSKLIPAPHSDLVDQNGVHIMNKSSNETNPDRKNNTVTNTSGYGSPSYPNSYQESIIDRKVTTPPALPTPTTDRPALNDARTNPPNSLSPNAPRPTQGSQRDPALPGRAR